METATHQADEDLLIQGLKSGKEADFQKAVRLYTPGMMAVARFYLDNASAEEQAGSQRRFFRNPGPGTGRPFCPEWPMGHTPQLKMQ